MVIFHSDVSLPEGTLKFSVEHFGHNPRHSPGEPSAPSTARQLQLLSVEGAAPAGPFLGSGSVEGGLQTTARQPPVAVGEGSSNMEKVPWEKWEKGKKPDSNPGILEKWWETGKQIYIQNPILKLGKFGLLSICFADDCLVGVPFHFGGSKNDRKYSTRFMLFFFGNVQ